MTEGDELVVDFEDEQRATSVSCVSSDWSTDSLCASEASEATANFSVSNSSSLSAALRLARAFCTRCDHDIMDESGHGRSRVVFLRSEVPLMMVLG